MYRNSLDRISLQPEEFHPLGAVLIASCLLMTALSIPSSPSSYFFLHGGHGMFFPGESWGGLIFPHVVNRLLVCCGVCVFWWEVIPAHVGMCMPLALISRFLFFSSCGLFTCPWDASEFLDLYSSKGDVPGHSVPCNILSFTTLLPPPGSYELGL